jgi:hypothetical protein
VVTIAIFLRASRSGSLARSVDPAIPAPTALRNDLLDSMTFLLSPLFYEIEVRGQTLPRQICQQALRDSIRDGHSWGESIKPNSIHPKEKPIKAPAP